MNQHRDLRSLQVLEDFTLVVDDYSTPCIEEGKGAMVLGGIHPECQSRFCTCVNTSVPGVRIKKKEDYLFRDTVDWHLGRVKG